MNKHLPNSKIKKAVIPAAGLGVRFLPATKAQPKEMLPIVDKPTIQYVVEEAVASGIEDILIITGRNKRAIEDHFDYCIEMEMVLQKKGKEKELEMLRGISEMADIHYVRQKEPLGLGHAILCARKFVRDEPFVVLLGDDIINSRVPCTKQLMEVYEEKRGTVLGVQAVDWQDVSKYGIIRVEDPAGPLYRVKGLVEKPLPEEAPSNLAALGRYLLEPEIFAVLEKTPPGRGGEIQLTDALHEMAGHRPVWAYNFSGKRYDVGDREGFLAATVEYALRRDDLSEPFAAYLRRLVENDPRLKPHGERSV